MENERRVQQKTPASRYALLDELRATHPDMLGDIWKEESPLVFDSTGHLNISWPEA
mgnify:CR=1 FL=1